MESAKENTAWQIAEVELVYRNPVKVSKLPKVGCSEDAYRILRQNWDDGRIGFIEQFKILLLNRDCRVLGVYEVSTGGISATVADPKLIFTAALKCRASSVILSHNHPSGNLNPSQEDLNTTRKLCDAGRILGIKVLDHIILTDEGHYSFAEEGVL